MYLVYLLDLFCLPDRVHLPIDLSTYLSLPYLTSSHRILSYLNLSDIF